MNNDLYITIYEDEGNSDRIPFYADYPSNSFSVYDVDFAFDYDYSRLSLNMVCLYTSSNGALPLILSCFDCVKIFSDSESVNIIVRPQIFARLQTNLSKYIR